MTIYQVLALFVALITLGAVPSLSVFMVVTRSASFGFIHGVLTTIGIIFGDLVFIALAVWGLGQLQGVLGPFFLWLRYLGGIYLIILGLGLWRAKSTSHPSVSHLSASKWASFGTGLSITLADQKATLFYLGFLPAFVNIETLTWRDFGLVCLTMILAVGMVKLLYAALAERALVWLQPKFRRRLNQLAGVMVITVGLVLFLS